jgi:transketolase
MAALMGIRNILVYTHDSIGLGEDGPTHQPVEHVASLRLIPNLHVWRPCDGSETAVAWKHAVERRDGPSALVLTRQNVVHQAKDDHQIEAIGRGAYVLRDCDGEPELLLIATGSEVGLAVDAAAMLASEGVAVRVVSMPCAEVFDGQDHSYRDSVLPPGVRKRVAIEAGVSECWWRHVGPQGAVVGLDRFGASGRAEELFEHFGFSAGDVADVARRVLAG